MVHFSFFLTLVFGLFHYYCFRVVLATIIVLYSLLTELFLFLVQAVIYFVFCEKIDNKCIGLTGSVSSVERDCRWEEKIHLEQTLDDTTIQDICFNPKLSSVLVGKIQCYLTEPDPLN